MDRILHGASALARNAVVILLLMVFVLLVVIIISFKSDQTQSKDISAAAGEVQSNTEDVKANTEQLLRLAALNRRLIRTVLDCTEPSGQCHKRGQQQTADAVNAITTSAGLFVVCSAVLDPTSAAFEDEVFACVADRLPDRLPDLVGGANNASQ